MTQGNPAPPPRKDYREAALRHHKDARLLLEQGRRANADHLFGIAAECALLGIMRTSPTARDLFDAAGEVSDRLRVHVNVLWNQFCKEAQGRRLGSTVSRLRDAYPGRPRSPGDRPPPENPFKGWSVDQRYLSDAGVESELTDDVVKRHRGGCGALLEAAR